MDPEELKRRYVRKPTQASKEGLSPKRKYYVYRADGTYMGQFSITYAKREWYEKRGFTFEAVYR